jgi:hypothetical protein
VRTPSLLIVSLLTLAAAALHGQSQFPMEYLDEIGHLGGLDPRTTVNLGVAKATADPDGKVRLEGRDAAGKPWQVWTGLAGGIGGTDVWIADFDHNGRRDLLLASYAPANGRCVDGVTIYTLMFDDLGSPCPGLDVPTALSISSAVLFR